MWNLKSGNSRLNIWQRARIMQGRKSERVTKRDYETVSQEKHFVLWCILFTFPYCHQQTALHKTKQNSSILFPVCLSGALFVSFPDFNNLRHLMKTVANFIIPHSPPLPLSVFFGFQSPSQKTGRFCTNLLVNGMYINKPVGFIFFVQFHKKGAVTNNSASLIYDGC